MRKETGEKILSILNGVANVVIPIVILKICEKTIFRRTSEYIFIEDEYVDYDAVVNKIISSDMYTDKKLEALDLICVGKSIDYYSTIMNILNSDLYSSKKIEAIKKINSKF